MSNPFQSGSAQGGRPLLRGRVLGFPVHLDLSFVIIMALLGLGYGARDLVIWLLITPFAVLTHELGHAVLARAAGASPEITLAGFGGVTTYLPLRQLSRARSLGISLAGPAVGLVLGGALYGVRQAFLDSLVPGSWQVAALDIGIWTCLGWSLFNLLPIVPLDGGQALRELLPGSPEVRASRAAVVSLPVAALAAVVAYGVFHQPYIAFFMAIFAVTNGLSLRSSSAARSGSGPRSGSGRGGAPVADTPERAVVALLWQGQPAQARELLASLPPTPPIDLVVHGAVLSLTGDPTQGHALIQQELQRRPRDENVAAMTALTQALEHDWDALIGMLQGPVGPYVPTVVVERAIEEARGIGREDVAGRLQVIIPGSLPQ